MTSAIYNFPYFNVVLIDRGTVAKSSDPSRLGCTVFLVSYADAAGIECILYDTRDPVKASQEAKALKRDFGAVAVIERFRREGGRNDG